MHNTQINISVVTMTAAIMININQMRVNFIGPTLMNESFPLGAVTDVDDGDIVVVVVVVDVVVVVSRRKLTTTILETSLLWLESSTTLSATMNSCSSLLLLSPMVTTSVLPASCGIAE